jgi:hypothetical protein
MTPAETIIARFGGIRAAARRLEKPDSTVSDWKKAGLIPLKHMRLILVKAEEAGISIEPADFLPPAKDIAADLVEPPGEGTPCSAPSHDSGAVQCGK